MYKEPTTLHGIAVYDGIMVHVDGHHFVPSLHLRLRLAVVQHREHSLVLAGCTLLPDNVISHKIRIHITSTYSFVWGKVTLSFFSGVNEADAFIFCL